MNNPLGDSLPNFIGYRGCGRGLVSGLWNDLDIDYTLESDLRMGLTVPLYQTQVSGLRDNVK